MTSPYVCTAMEEHPNGTRVITRITVPTEVAWRDVRECAELAQMGASHTMSRALTSKRESDERVPF